MITREILTTYFILWKLNLNIPPTPDPRAGVQQLEGFLTMMKNHLNSGIMKESHTFLKGDAGYVITGDISDENLIDMINVYYPFVTFEVHKTLPTIKTIESAINAAKRIAGQS